MSEFLGSLASYFNTRLKTPFYGLIAFWWAVLHWEFFYTALFVDQQAIMDKTGLLKNEYLALRFCNWHDWKWWVLQTAKLLVAFGLTYLMIWVFPKRLLLRAFIAQKQHEYDKKQEKLKFEQQQEKEQTKLETQSVEKLKVKKKRAKLEKDIIKDDPRLIWEEEYRRLKSTPLHQKFGQLVRSLYAHGGSVKFMEGAGVYRRVAFQLDQEVLAYADTNELVEYDRKNGIISLTEKGKYFVKRFQEKS